MIDEVARKRVEKAIIAMDNFVYQHGLDEPPSFVFCENPALWSEDIEPIPAANQVGSEFYDATR